MSRFYLSQIRFACRTHLERGLCSTLLLLPALLSSLYCCVGPPRKASPSAHVANVVRCKLGHFACQGHWQVGITLRLRIQEIVIRNKKVNLGYFIFPRRIQGFVNWNKVDLGYFNSSLWLCLARLAQRRRYIHIPKDPQPSLPSLPSPLLRASLPVAPQVRTLYYPGASLRILSPFTATGASEPATRNVPQRIPDGTPPSPPLTAK